MQIQLDTGAILEIDEWQALCTAHQKVFAKYAPKFGKVSNEAIRDAIREHISNKYPGSQHWDPNKVNVESDEVVVDIPGANRAYKDIDIYPQNVAWLCIPTRHAKYLGINSPKDTSGRKTFKPKNHNIIAEVINGSLTALFALSKHVHQNQDSSLMPSEDTLATAVYVALDNLMK